MNIVAVVKKPVADSGEKILKEIIKRSCGRISETFRLKSGAALCEAKRIIAEKEIDYFFDLTGELEFSEIKKMKPEKHTFFVSVKDSYGVNECELFETGFKALQKSRGNLLAMHGFPDSAKGYKYMIVYPEKTYNFFTDKEKFIKQLAEDIFKRENTSHPRSIQVEKFARIPKEVYARFHSVGRILFEKGFLPIVGSGTYGNFSMLHKGTMYITGRGVDKGNLDIRYICRIQKVEEVEETPKIFAEVYYSGSVKPSIDTAIIYSVYQMTDWQAIVHIHTDQMFAGLPITGYNFPCGTKEEMEEIANLLKEKQGADIIQQYNHGLLIMGKNFQDCLDKIEKLFEHGVSVKKMEESEKNKKEFKEWESHYKKMTRGKNVDIDIYDFNSLWLVSSGKVKVGLLYLKPKEKVLYFVFYTFAEFTKKGLGLGEKIIQIVSRIAERTGYGKIGILTTKECNVYSYYEKRGFQKTCEDDSGSIWMERKLK